MLILKLGMVLLTLLLGGAHAQSGKVPVGPKPQKKSLPLTTSKAAPLKSKEDKSFFNILFEHSKPNPKKVNSERAIQNKKIDKEMEDLNNANAASVMVQ